MRHLLYRLGMAAVLLGGLGMQPVAVRADSNGLGDDQKLEGGWDIVITEAGPFKPTPFRILRTISSSGVVDAYAFPSFTATPGAVNSSGHGAWKRIGNRLYSATVKYFQLTYGTAPLVLDSIGTVRENITLSADGNSYTSVFVTEVRKPDGTLVLINSGKTAATRIQVQPLP